MRPWAAAASVAAIAACSDTRGIEISATVPSGASVDRLLLYLAHPATGALAATPLTITPDGSPVPTEIYARIDTPLEVTSAQLAGSDTAVFLIEPGVDGLGAEIPYAIVVGMSGGSPQVVGTLADLAMPNGKVAEYDVPLGLAGSDARRVELWGGSDAATSCIRVGPAASDTSTVATAIVMSADDPDCDGFTGTQECDGDDAIYDGSHVGSDLSCAGSATLIDSNDPTMTPYTTCILGAPRCDDGSPRTCGSDAIATPICAAPSLCALCPHPEVDVTTCVATADLSTTTWFECDFSFSIDAASQVPIACQETDDLPKQSALLENQPLFRLPGGTFAQVAPITPSMAASIVGAQVTLAGSAFSTASLQTIIVTTPDGSDYLRGIAGPMQINVQQVDTCNTSGNGACTLHTIPNDQGNIDTLKCVGVTAETGSSGSG